MIFIDSNIPMYAAGRDSPQKEACYFFLEKVAEGRQRAASSAEVLQEILHRYRAIHRLEDGLKVYDLFRALPLSWLEVRPEDVDRAREILSKNPKISSRDALHVAVMKHHGIKKVVTYDQGFAGIPGITALVPSKA